MPKPHSIRSDLRIGAMQAALAPTLCLLALLPACDVGAPAASPTPVVRMVSPTSTPAATATLIPTHSPTPIQTSTPRPDPTATLVLPAGRIAFQRWIRPIRGSEELPTPFICVMATDHSSPLTEITEGENPRWSPDGTRIAFERVQEGNRDIWVINADGTHETRLTRSSQCDMHLDWAPDGQGIVFVSGLCDAPYGTFFGPGNTDIYYVRVDGSGLVKLTNTPDRAESSPRWSPDGRQIAYDVGGLGDAEHVGLRDQIRVMNADGSQPTVVFRCADFCGLGAWSPDGRRLVVGMAGTGATRIIALDGSTVVNISGIGEEGILSPDGQHMVGTWWCQDPPPGESTSCLHIVNADGSGLRPLTTRFGVEPSWSPDGQWIVYRSHNLWLARADGSQLVPLTNEDDYQYLYLTPEWAPK